MDFYFKSSCKNVLFEFLILFKFTGSTLNYRDFTTENYTVTNLTTQPEAESTVTTEISSKMMEVTASESTVQTNGNIYFCLRFFNMTMIFHYY